MPDLPVFEVGRTYTCQSIVDHTYTHRYEVVRRTAKFITVNTGPRAGGLPTEMRVGVRPSSEGEWAMPEGQHSMCPVIRAYKFEEEA